MKALISILVLSFLYLTPARAAANKYDLTFNFGPSLSQGGNIQDLGSPNYSTGIGFNWFLKEKHGIGFSFNSEYDFDGGSKFKTLNNASISTFDVHYAYRYIKNKFQLVFEPGFGWQTVYTSSVDPYWGYLYLDDVSTGLVLDWKLFARYNLTDLPEDANFFVGAGLINIYSLNDEYQGKDITGNRLAMLFQLGVGW